MPKQQFTPWNPSKKAESRVHHNRPAPKVCDCCGGEIKIMDRSVFYGRKPGRGPGKYPWVYQCTKCHASVGMHPDTAIPLGRMANGETRWLRKQAKFCFDKLWKKGNLTRTQAYGWLSMKLRIPKRECHIGLFDVNQCKKVIQLCEPKEK